MSAQLAGYNNQYPKMLYGPDRMTMTVSSAMEEEALGPEWGSVPTPEHLAPLAANSVRMDNAPQRLAPPVASPVPVPAAPQPQAFDQVAIAELIALRVAEILAPMLPKRTGRPPNSEKEATDG